MTAHWALPERRARVRRSVRLDGSVWTTDKDGIVPALLSAEVRLTELAGETIQTVLTQAPGNGAPIGGVKVIAKSGWFAARPSGTEDIYKIYAESFVEPIICAAYWRKLRPSSAMRWRRPSSRQGFRPSQY